MSNQDELSRRGFMQKTTAAGAAAYIVPAVALGAEEKPPASERITVGLIGCGGMGQGNARNCAKYPDVEITGVSDCWRPRCDAAAGKFKAKPYPDYRDMLAEKDLDAVIVATPPHWHCRMTVDACEAGKDVYLQKPMTLHLGESLAVKNAVKKHKRICQIGTQIHAGQNYRRVVELIRAGNIGRVSVAQTFNVMNQGPGGIGHDPGTKPPEGLDWNMWVGPHPMRPYNRLLAANSFNHCFFMISGGWTPGMAPHIVDLPVWALDLGYPEITYCSGGRYVVKDDGDAPDTQEVTWQYPDFSMTWWMSTVNSFAFDFGRGKPARRLGIYFHGVDGTLYANYGMHEVVPEGNRMKDRKPPEEQIPPSPGHEREWLDCITTRKQPSCSPEYHGKIDVALVLANLSMKLGRSIRFDPKTEKIVGDPEATKQAVPEYRDPWKFPTAYL